MTGNGAGAPVHASVVALDGRGVLIRGRSGSGKSSLVLALLDQPSGMAVLVADDRVTLAVAAGRILASVPDVIAGKLEVRGQGIFDMPFVSPCSIALVVDLLPADECPRFPDENDRITTILGVAVPRLMLPEGTHDGATRVRFALRQVAS